MRDNVPRTYGVFTLSTNGLRATAAAGAVVVGQMLAPHSGDVVAAYPDRPAVEVRVPGYPGGSITDYQPVRQHETQRGTATYRRQ